MHKLLVKNCLFKSRGSYRISFITEGEVGDTHDLSTRAQVVNGTGFGRAMFYSHPVLKVVTDCIPFLKAGGSGGRGWFKKLLFGGQDIS